jgi:Holliday junction resolvasome RuvABC endonuclease subunit
MDGALAVGIDQSANSTAVVVLDLRGQRVAHTLIEPPNGCRDLARLVFVRDTLGSFLAALPRCAIGVREGYSYKSTHRAFLLGEIGGIVQLALHAHCDRVEECAPAALKKFTAGRGGADKKTMIEAVARRWGYRYDCDDLADAHGLAMVALGMLDPASLTRRADLDVVAPAKREKRTIQRAPRVVRTGHGKDPLYQL